MFENVPEPDPRSLLPPLLACLPAGFTSPRPPPVLLPLLSPILRQRVQLLNALSTSSSESWLRLLCWNSTRAHQLERVIGEASFEPHPISGEIEIPDDTRAQYKLVDLETLRARFSLESYRIVVILVWCPNDQEGGGAGWRVSEVLPHDAIQEEATGSWSDSIEGANEAYQDSVSNEETTYDQVVITPSERHTTGGDSDYDNDYWAQYDDSLGRTPARQHSPIPRNHHQGNLQRLQDSSEMSYFDRYNGVQPAMDNDDPSANPSELGTSSLNGDTFTGILRQQIERIATRKAIPETPPAVDGAPLLSHPRPESASSNGSDAVLRLERTAADQSVSEMGVREYLSSNIRSLHRLAKSAGISGEAFGNIIRNELEMLEAERL